MIDRREIVVDEPGVFPHPVLRVLAGSPDSSSICFLPDRTRGWTSALASAIESLPPGAALVVICDRDLPQTLLHLLKHRRLLRSRSPSLRRLEHALRTSGLDVVARYALWTSTAFPRLAFPLGSSRTLRWLQRTGLLGDVGQLPRVRGLMRSSAFTPIARFLTPGFALVARGR